MRALIVSSYPPPLPGYDINGGARRFGMFAQATASISQTIDFLHFLPPGGTVQEVPTAIWDVPLEVTFATRRARRETPWNQYGAGIFSVLEQPEYYSFGGEEQAAYLETCLDRKPDLVYVAGLPCMIPFLRLKRDLPPIFFDINDVDHKLLGRTIFTKPIWPGKLAAVFQIPALMAAERRCIARSAYSSVCSDVDVRYLERLGSGKGVLAIPNAVPMPTEGMPVASEKTILFLGFFGYEPNVGAAERLIKQVSPLIRQRCPDTRLIIAGKSPERIPSYGQQHDGVEFAGFVDDLAALYRRSKLVCCPMINGGGTRVKLVEAAGYAKPIVSTAIGAEGLSLVDGTELLIRESDEDIAAACVQLLNDDDLCQRLGNAARQKARSLYDIEHIRSRISALMLDAVSPAAKKDVNAS